MTNFTPRYTNAPDSHNLRTRDETRQTPHPNASSDVYEPSLGARRPVEPSSSPSAQSSRFGPPNQTLYTSRKDIQGLSFWRGEESEAEEPEDDEEEWEERQSPLTFVLVVAVFIVVSAMGWFIFRWAMGPSTSTPPLIQASSDPYKVRPENPGGMMIPHQDKLVYGRLSPEEQQQPVERLLPPPEQPMVLQQAPQQQMAGQPPVYGQQQQPYPPQQMVPPQQGQNPAYPPQPGMAPQQQGPSIQQGGQQQQAGYVQPQQMPPQQQQMQQPYPQQGHQQVQPQQMPYGGQQQAQQQAQMYPQQNTPPYPTVGAPQQQGQPNPVRQVLPPQNRGPQNAIPQNQGINRQEEGMIGDLDQLIAQEAQGDLETEQSPGSKGGTEQPFTSPSIVKKGGKSSDAQLALEDGDKPLVNAKAAGVTSHKYRVQVASVQSQGAADKELKRLKSGSHGAVFSGKKIAIQKIETSGKGTAYRLIAGSFPNRDAASQFCRKLKGHGIGCLIVNPTPE